MAVTQEAFCEVANNLQATVNEVKIQKATLAEQQTQIASQQVLFSELTNSKAVLENSARELKAQLDAQATLKDAKERLSSDRGLVDHKNFKLTWDGQPSKFNDWKFKFTNLCCSKYPGAEKVLKWVRDEDIQTTMDKANKKIGEIEGLLDINNQLYSAFSCLLENEPLSITQNVSDRNGCEVWRKLHHCYDPQSASRRKDKLRDIMRNGKIRREGSSI